MSLVEPQPPPERRLSPGLTVSLPTNNPFRKGPSSPRLDTPPERPASRNPFLDQSPDPVPAGVQQKPMSPGRVANGGSSPQRRQPLGESATADILSRLSLSDAHNTNGTTNIMAPPRTTNRPARVENVPPSTNTRGPVHRSSRSQEEHQQRLRTSGRPRGSEQVLDIFADPIEEGKPYDQRPRRNSDSSVTDRNGKTLDPEEERRRRERRHRDSQTRLRDSKGRPIPVANGPRGKKPSPRLDVIDKLDVTSIYGTGLFHHDGPFDACNPHRNRKGVSRAPMQAFPKDSANNVIGGSGPVNKNIDIAKFHGHGADSFTDYSTAAATVASPVVYEPYAGASAPFRGDARPGIDRTSSFNPTAKADMVHGDLSMGLGTSTFLEGAPAPRVAIQRRESEGEFAGNGSLSRKKSLAQKIRGISNARRDGGPRGLGSPEPRYERTTSPTETPGGTSLPRVLETNLFEKDYDAAYDKKGASIKVAEERNQLSDEGVGRARAPSSPMRPAVGMNVLERQATNEGGEAEEGKTGGFLSRVKSLRGGGRNKPRVERRETSG